MRKIFAITFLTIYLFSNTELHQFLKLPILIEHYSEHKDKDHSITLWKFLSMHYANGNTKDADYDKDSKLPFKTHDNCNSSNHITILPEQKFFFNSVVQSFEKKILFKFYSVFPNATFLENIWQPPKFC